MNSISALHGSDESGNASVATVQSVRAPLATTLAVDTVEGIGAKFFGSMGTPHTFVDPVTSETITVISDATAVDFAGHVDGGNLEIDTISPGYTDAGSAVGDIVIIKPTTQYADNLADVLGVEHNDDGTHGDVTADTLEVTGATTIQGNKPWCYLNSATHTGGVVTGAGTTPTLITDLSVGVTIPAGATAVRITVDTETIYPQTGTAECNLMIFEGATSGALTTQVGGTQANSASSVSAYNSIGHAVTVIKTPTAGATFFSAAISASASNAQVPTSTTTPATIQVEVC